MVGACSGSVRSPLLDQADRAPSIRRRLPAARRPVTMSGTLPPARRPPMRPLPLLSACLLLLFTLPAAAQKDKEKDRDEKTFSGKTISAWVKDLSSKEVTDR